jgi:carbon monoxide dehydrogenase subunit G
VRVEVTRRCEAPPDVVWEWVADPHRHIQMLPDSIRGACVLEDGDVQAELNAGGVRELMRVRVTSTDPPHRLDEERVDGVRRGSTAFLLKPADGGTLVTIQSDVDVPRLLSAVAKPAVARALEQQLANLDRLSADG